MSFLNKKIVSLDPQVFGIDLSDLSVKVMQIERDGKIEKVRSYSSVEIPPGLIENGKILNQEKVSSVIREAVKKAGPGKIKTSKVICSLPESKAFLRIISVPKMDEKEAREAIKWEMEANIPMPIDQVYYDWQFLGMENKNKQSVLTVAVSREIVDDLMDVMEMAKLDVYGLELESIASARSLISKKDSDRKAAALIVDLGAHRTSFIMVIGGAPYFTSSIPFSSESIDDAIAKGLNLNYPEAEKIKIAHGIESRENNPVFSLISPLLENLVQEIEKTLDFFAELNKENPQIEKIVLCGGGSNLKGLRPYLAKRLNREIEIGNAWINLEMGSELPIIDKENSARFPTVVGLALCGLDYAG